MLSVGGGTAGSVLAARLSEDKNVQVLVLEAGDEEVGNPSVEVPLASTSLRATDMDWNHRTVPQDSACLAMNDKVPMNALCDCKMLSW